MYQTHSISVANTRGSCSLSNSLAAHAHLLQMKLWIVWVQVQLPEFRRRHQLTMAPMAFTVALVLLSCSVAAVCWSSASERLHVIPVSWQVQAPIFGLQAV